MTKRFTNVADDGIEKALRRGFTVPKGAVNLSWVKAPALTPGNNVVVIDTSKAVSENTAHNTSSKKIAYANALGILEDENGNEVWDEEYPVISDIFSLSAEDQKREDYTTDHMLPFLHVSRHFHYDFGGISYGALEAFPNSGVKIVNAKGEDHVDENNQKRYKIYVAQAKNLKLPAGSKQTAYRIHVFFDMQPDTDELYLSYNKVDVSIGGGIKDSESDYKERINPRPYFRYIPEETEVIDRSSALKRVYSSKPSNVKQQVLGLPHQDAYGWKYIVPRKAIPDPRIFQLFRWRLACEMTQPSIQRPDDDVTPAGTFPVVTGNPTIIRVGVVIPPNGTSLNTRANYLFYEMNESDYNIAGIKFVNPLKSPNLRWNRAEQQKASYWHVDLTNMTLGDLSQFDILVWAPVALDANINTSALTAKINYFTDNLGGTFIYETSSLTSFPVDFTDVTYSSIQPSNRFGTDGSYFSTARMYDATASNTTDTFNTFGMWKVWPPNISDILNEYTDIGSILSSADVIAGWALDSGDLSRITGYKGIPNIKTQYINLTNSSYKIVAEASTTTTGDAGSYKPILVHKKTNSGGNVFISSGAFFEDHLFNINGQIAANTLSQNPDISLLPRDIGLAFKDMVSSVVMSGEMKLRYNVMLFATLNKPSPADSSNGNATNNGNSQSNTVYTDWQSTWVINAANGVLTDKEKTDNSFVLLPTGATAEDPVWQRVLSPKTLKQLIQEKIKQLDPDGKDPVFNKFEGASKRYFIMVTNPNVQVGTTSQLQDNSPPTAWTYAYSPKFDVPTHLGSYVVRDEMVSGGIGSGSGKRIYPPKPYDLQASVSYLNDSRTTSTKQATVTITVNGKKYVKAPDQVATRQVWVPGGPGRMVDVVEHWTTDGTGIRIGSLGQQVNYQRSYGIDIWSDVNYTNRPSEVVTYPYMGFHGVLSLLGGDTNLIKFVQVFLNQEIFFNQIPTPYLAEDGVFGPLTRQKVMDLQAARFAHKVSGIVDSEFWSMVGYGLMGFAFVPNWLTQAPQLLTDKAREVFSLMDNQNISNDDMATTTYGRITNILDNVSVIKEGFLITFNQSAPIWKIVVVPHVIGDSQHCYVDWVDVFNRVGGDFYEYNFDRGNPGSIELAGHDWEPIHIAFPPTQGDTVIVRMRQEGSMGPSWDNMKYIGVRDISVYYKRFEAGSPGYWRDETYVVPGSVYEVPFTKQYSTTMNFATGIPLTITASSALGNMSDYVLAGETLAGIYLDATTFSLSPDPGYFSVVFDQATSTASNVTITYNGYLNTLSNENFVVGPRLGNGTTSFYTKTEASVVDPYARTNGWITKDNGLKLICKIDGKPFGLPSAFPTDVNGTMHFARYKLTSFNTDQTIYYGFYDVNRDEWVTDSYGNPEISFYDYIRRGPQNIFIAVKTTYELDTNANVPGLTDTVTRPFKWAMPVYGVTSGLKPKIQIEPLAPDLGVQDMWPIPIRTGTFTRDITLRKKSESSLTNYLKDYQGTTVSAYYSVPEAKTSAWSSLYGRPYVDVKGEVPQIIDDDTIKVRQAPILVHSQPTVTSGPADPWYPVFKIYQRATLTSGWTVLPFSAIKDYDAGTGTITLVDPLTSNDPRLVKVDYTSERRVYDLKHDGTTPINLNPYTNNRPDWLDKPLYLYLLPEYILDATGTLITSSVRNRTIKITDTSTIFNTIQADYQPEAVLLGIIYISSAFDINDLIMLDTRRRGGGVTTDMDDEQGFRTIPEFDSLWDIDPETSVSYQNGGFVIIRLPVGLKTDFTDAQIGDVIERNITAGVRYKVEDLQGNRWSA